ncbi:DUF1028 domain-containing protein [Roseobacter sp. HKCCD7870]|uniref:DUF1028 domain-containing protein n=1 Tax=Roseobacter sp. HKCCD7870 TaxID=3120343 RepID=UPI0030EB4512
MTFSILTFDQKTGVFAGAAATGSLCVGGWVLRGDIESGLVASQGTAPSTFWRDEMLRGMFKNESAPQLLERITQPDTGKEFRQLAAVDRKGNSAAFTGALSIDYCGHLLEQGVAISGNMLSGPAVLDAMQKTNWTAVGDQAQRMLQVLDAAKDAGGDFRGLRSAALLVLKPNEPPLDLRIDCADKPIAALWELWHETKKSPYQDWLSEVPVLADRMRKPSHPFTKRRIS